MEDFVLEASAVLRTESNNSDTLKKNYFSPVWIGWLMSLRKDFVDVELLKGIQACSLKSENLLSKSHLNELAKHYSIDLKTKGVLVARNVLAHPQSCCLLTTSLSIEKGCASASNNRVIDRFATLKNRRHSLMLPSTKYQQKYSCNLKMVYFVKM
ncbi:hypothetical protein AMECASPLE_036218, partial [Ameca splendens]